MPNCSCDCNAVDYEGDFCQIKTKCDQTDIQCGNGGKITGFKADLNCSCDCTALPNYEGQYCLIETQCDLSDIPCKNSAKIEGTK